MVFVWCCLEYSSVGACIVFGVICYGILLGLFLCMELLVLFCLLGVFRVWGMW